MFHSPTIMDIYSGLFMLYNDGVDHTEKEYRSILIQELERTMKRRDCDSDELRAALQIWTNWQKDPDYHWLHIVSGTINLFTYYEDSYNDN
jgi:hypothetical protein